MQLKDAVRKRKSVRKYGPKKPDWRKILNALEYAAHAPAAGNLYNMKFILVSDKKVIESLAKLAEQDFIASTHYVVVAISDDSKLVRSYGERGARYSDQQAGAAIENFLLALTEKELSTCWIGYFDEIKVRDLLSIPEKMRVEAFFPIGFETGKVERRKDVDFQNIIYYGSWGNKTFEPQTRVTNDSA